MTDVVIEQWYELSDLIFDILRTGDVDDQYDYLCDCISDLESFIVDTTLDDEVEEDRESVAELIDSIYTYDLRRGDDNELMERLRDLDQRMTSALEAEETD